MRYRWFVGACHPRRPTETLIPQGLPPMPRTPQVIKAIERVTKPAGKASQLNLSKGHGCLSDRVVRTRHRCPAPSNTGIIPPHLGLPLRSLGQIRRTNDGH